MTEKEFPQVKWTAAFVGFGVDWVFSELVGLTIMAAMLALRGVALDSDQPVPSDVLLVRQLVGVAGAVVGGVAAGYLAGQRGSLHGVLGSVIGLVVVLCSIPVLGEFSLSIGDVGFIVLNLVGAGYGGGVGERWRLRRQGQQ